MIRFGILGCGRIGQVHARTLHRLRGARVAAVSDAMPLAAETLAEEVGAEVRASDAILSAGDIDAIAICTPTDTHADLIEAAAHAGKPVFCEKPIDLDIDRVKACLETVAATGTPLLVGFQRRFDPHFRALKDALTAGRIGRIEQIMITSRDPGPPPLDYIKRSGGQFRDMTIHDFDMARFLLDGPITRVLAVGGALVDPAIGSAGDTDTATVLMETTTGAQVVITNSRRATYGYDQRVEVLGSDGMLQVGNQPETALRTATSSGFEHPVLLDFFMVRYKDAYANEMRAFMDMVETGAPPPVSGQDGLEALRLADAADRSARSGAWVVL
ncbi:inositol 2-dehydrogenase [Tropicimonas sp. S265A]|uniref:inositol 2-dehydrogenase n=1 Tax=Tropicimonas sp. S265A TaxID=3415134 RepID=UPI003C7DD2C3